jgi:hypothetical protein
MVMVSSFKYQFTQIIMIILHLLTLYGTFVYRRMLFGPCNAAMMAIFFSDLIENTMKVFMNDFSV